MSEPRGSSGDSAKGWRQAWSAPRARVWLVAAIVASWLPLLGMPGRGWLDFSAFYAGGSLAFTLDVLSLSAVESFQAARNLPNTPFLYPPALAIVYAPFAALPYHLAAMIHVVVQAAALITAALLGARVFGIQRRWAILGTLAWSPAAGAVVSGQNSAVLLLLTMAAAWGLMTGRRALSGLAIGLAGYRPHLGLPLFGLLIWRMEWVAAVVAVGTLGVQYLLGIVASGGALDWPFRWLSTVAAETANDFNSVGWQAIGLPGILGRLSLGGSAPGSIFGPALIGYIAGLALLALALRPLREWDPPRAFALTCALALFAGPRGFAYDATMLLPAVAVLARDAAARGWPWRDRWLLAVAYGIALLWPVGGFIGLNPLAILVLAAPFVLMAKGPFRRFAAEPVGILARP